MQGSLACYASNHMSTTPGGMRIASERIEGPIVGFWKLIFCATNIISVNWRDKLEFSIG
jgi:hypothetical protein